MNSWMVQRERAFIQLRCCAAQLSAQRVEQALKSGRGETHREHTGSEKSRGVWAAYVRVLGVGVSQHVYVDRRARR